MTKSKLGILLLVLVVGFYYREVIFKGLVPLPADTLVGAYFPWLDYKWGYPVGVPVKNALLSDAFSHFFVLKGLVIDLLKSGQLPFWNRFIFSGTPLLSTFHVSPLFPANLLFWLPGLWGWRLFIFGSSLFATFSLYLYLGRWVKSTLARLAAALVFAFAGPMTTWVEFGTAVWAAGFIPLIFLCLDRAILDHRRLYFWLISPLFAAMILAGQVQLLTYFLPLAAGYTLLLLKMAPQKHSLYRLLPVFLAFLIGGLITGLQLVPTFKLFGYSIRAQEHYSAEFNYGLVHFSQLIRLWLPDFFGHPATGNHWSRFVYHEYSGFFGTLTLPLILPLLLKKYRSPIGNFFWGVVALSLILVVSHPLSQAIFSLKLPMLTYSSASRLFFLTGLGAACLLGLGLDKFSQKSYRRVVAVWSLVFILLTGLALFLAPSTYRLIALRNSILPLSLLTLLVAFSLLSLSTVLLVAAIFLLTAFDLGRYFRKYNPFVPERLVFPTTPVLDYLKSRPGVFRIARESTNLLPPNNWLPYGLESIEGYEPLRPLLPGQLFHRIKDDPLLSRVSRYSELEDISPKYLDALNVQYFLALDPGAATPSSQLKTILDHGYQKVFQDQTTQVYRNPTALPRAYFVGQVISATATAQMAQIMNSPEFDPRTITVVTDPLPPTSAPTRSRVDLVTYQDNYLKLNLSTDAAALLVIANSYDPGWAALLDQKPVKLYPVNHALQGVVIPEGDHQLELAYRPPGWRLGLYLSAAGFIIWLLFLWRWR